MADHDYWIGGGQIIFPFPICLCGFNYSFQKFSFQLFQEKHNFSFVLV